MDDDRVTKIVMECLDTDEFDRTPEQQVIVQLWKELLTVENSLYGEV